MRGVTGSCALILGVLGLLFCVAAIGFGWYAAVRTVDRVTQVTARLDRGLEKTDARLARVESRLTASRGELGLLQRDAAKLDHDNPELPRVAAEIHQLLSRLIPIFQQLQDIADSLDTMSGGLDAMADLIDLFDRGSDLSQRVRTTAASLDDAADFVNAPNAKIESFKSGKAVKIVNELADVIRAVIAGSQQVAQALTATRQETTEVRGQLGDWRARLVGWIFGIALLNTLLWLWCGLGQLALTGWGRRTLTNPVMT